ncbi:hypothetical protein PR048_015576 [Dryococelus australis]|uniref:Uncharacterized protein n=1 Tax=Dryococelus australis TaxID=614101 RepID=A0ABQ9HHA6_9NEOP|nr:hypothetical protein PR048_015576 [Dryococelus australis]
MSGAESVDRAPYWCNIAVGGLPAAWTSSLFSDFPLALILFEKRPLYVTRGRGGQINRASPRRTRFNSRRDLSRIFPCVDRSGRCRWSAGFLGDLLFPPPVPSGAAPYSSRFTLTGYQDVDVESRPTLATKLPRPSKGREVLSTEQVRVQVLGSAASHCRLHSPIHVIPKPRGSLQHGTVCTLHPRGCKESAALISMQRCKVTWAGYWRGREEEEGAPLSQITRESSGIMSSCARGSLTNPRGGFKSAAEEAARTSLADVNPLRIIRCLQPSFLAEIVATPTYADADNRIARISHNALDADAQRRNLFHSDWPPLIGTHRNATHRIALLWNKLKERKYNGGYTLYVTEYFRVQRLVCSPPTKENRVQSPVGSSLDFLTWELCRWSTDFLGDLPFPLPFHSGAAPYSPQDLAVKSRPILTYQ